MHNNGFCFPEALQMKQKVMRLHCPQVHSISRRCVKQVFSVVLQMTL